MPAWSAWRLISWKSGLLKSNTHIIKAGRGVYDPLPEFFVFIMNHMITHNFTHNITVLGKSIEF